MIAKLGPRRPAPPARNPLKVTDRALAALARRRAGERPRHDQAIGLVSGGDLGVGLVLDVPDPADRLHAWQGTPVLFVAAAVAARFAGSVLDYRGVAGAERFVVVGGPDPTRVAAQDHADGLH